MRRKISLLLSLLFFTGFLSFSGGQFTPEEVSQRPQWEEFLKTAEIIGHDDVGEGVTKPTWLTLKKGDTVKQGLWKNPRGIQQGFLEGWQYEIAAYEVDKLLELHMIPPTVERAFNGKEGSLQLRIEKEYSELEIMDQRIPMPPDKREHRENMKYITRAFDSLIGNDDRTQQNILYTKDWRTILIDHSRAFRSTREHSRQLMYGKNGIKGELLFKRLPRKFVEKVKGLTLESIQNAVGPYLTKKEINALLARRELLLKEIKEMIKERGEDNVLY